MIEDRFFLRCENGRLAIGPAAVENAGRLNVVLVLPSWPIPSLDKWRKALYELVRERNGVLKTVYFDHEDDNVIQEALTGDFSRVFLELPVIPELTRQRLCGMRDKVVLLQHDLTDFGLTCLDAASPENMGLLVDHLHMLGHRKIALLNTQPLNEVITGRIEVFRRRSAELGLEHQFFNAPVNTFERADHKAYELAGGIIRRERRYRSARMAGWRAPGFRFRPSRSSVRRISNGSAAICCATSSTGEHRSGCSIPGRR